MACISLEQTGIEPLVPRGMGYSLPTALIESVAHLIPNDPAGADPARLGQGL
jgi:hypothetical protein